MKRHSRKPRMEFISGRSCVECAHGADYIQVMADSRRGGTVMCRKHRCRVYALGGACPDYKQEKEVQK